MGSGGLATFLFELASDERLGILEAIARTSLRHAQIARRLDMTESETTRHLNRLSSIGLVKRNPRGEYEHTNVGRLLLAGVPFLRFLEMNREFLLNHNVLVLPTAFVERLGALSDAVFTKGTYKVVATQVKALRAVNRRIWVLSEQAFDQAIPIMVEKVPKGVDVRVIRPSKGFEDAVPALSGKERNYPLRLLPEARIFLAVLDEIAGVCFPTTDGNVDMSTMLLLQDPRGYQWATELFLHFWEQARDAQG